MDKTIKTIPSYEVAKMMGKEHWEVLRMLEGSKDRKGIIPTLNDCGVVVSDYFIKSTYVDKKGETRKCYECTKLGLDLLCNRMQGKAKIILKNYINSNFENECVAMFSIERKEIEFLNQLKEVLEPFNLKGIKQYSIINKYGTRYRIDYYIPSLNIAIEYDENDHSNYTYEAHEGRQMEIEDILGCRFIRVSDSNTNEYNIGFVIKNIFNKSGTLDYLK